MHIPTTQVKAFVVALAAEHGVTYSRTGLDALAETITRLSGDDVVADDVADLLVALKRSNIISGRDMVQILGNYLRELHQDEST